MSEVRCRIDFSLLARDDLRDILNWYASQEVPQLGVRTVLKIVDRVRQLAVSPDSGRVVPELETPWLRELAHPPYRIVYRRDESVITIVRVWRSERLMDQSVVRNA